MLRQWLRGLAARLLPARDREFILGDLAEMRVRWSREDGRMVALGRWVRAYVASVVARRLGGGKGGGRGGGRAPGGRGSRALSELWFDVRQAVRVLSRRPGFVLVVALTLGVGVGSAVAVFGMVNQLVLRPVPGVRDPSGAAFVLFESERTSGVSGPVAEELRRSATLLEGIATYDGLRVHASVPGSRPIEAAARTVYGDYFGLLGVRPVMGRLLGPEETGPDADPSVAVISERLWERLFARAPDVIGRRIEANDRLLTVIGVTGGGFAGTDRFEPIDMWVPRSAFVTLEGFPPDRLWSPSSTLNQWFVVRPRAGVSFEAVEAQLDDILGRLSSDAAHRDVLEGLEASVYPGLHASPSLRMMIYPALRVLAGAVLLLLLVPCANVANLLLVRGVHRRGEVAVQYALGARSGRVVRQRLVESVILACAGAVSGLGVAWLISLFFRGERILSVLPFGGLAMDWRVLGFAVLLVLATTLLSGALPAVLSAWPQPIGALRDSGTRVTRRFTALRHGMSAFQIGLSLMLLIGGILLTRTVRNLYSVDTGMALDRVAALQVNFGPRRPEGAALDALHREVLSAVEAVPGVDRAALHSWYGPYSGRLRNPIATMEPGAEPLTAHMDWVSPGWFELMGIQAVSGRTFSERDWSASPLRVVMTAPLARRLFGHTDVVGQRILTGYRDALEAEIVGVIGDIRLTRLDWPPDEAYFLSSPTMIALTQPLTILTRAPDARTLEAVRAAVERVVPDLPVSHPAPLTDRIDAQLSEQRLFARLVGLLSGLAVPVAAVGLYGVIAFAVAVRKREFAIRVAVGADRRGIARLVFGSAGIVVGTGLVLGLAGAYALSRVIESRLYGVAALDLLSWAGAAAILALAALLACLAPARAAVSLDPMVALREE